MSKFAARTDAGRRAQLANLKQNNPELSKTHGAYSPMKAQERSAELLAELSSSMPSASQAELEIQAVRWAQIELLREHVYEKGSVRDRRKGDIYPAAALLEKISTAFERQHALLMERELAAAKAAPRVASEEELELRRMWVEIEARAGGNGDAHE
jgi:hypothetical protein